MKWVKKVKGWETMKMNKKYFGNTALVVWLLFSIWVGVNILQSYGESIGAGGVAYTIAWVLVIFAGRFAIEWLINKLWVTS